MEETLPLEVIYKMLSALSVDNKKWIIDHLSEDVKEGNGKKPFHYGLSDEELEKELALYPSWDEIEHADLSNIDYSKYKPYRSRKVQETIAKWL